MTEFTGNPLKKGLIVSPIGNGTVLDHLPAGRGIMIAKMLGLMEGNVVIVGQNLRSTKYGKKDLIKVEDRFLTEEECSKIALVAPRATVNIIRDSTIQEKRSVSVPDLVEGVVICSNANCITNKEQVQSRLRTVSRTPLLMVCTYCCFEVRGEDLRLR